MLTCKCKFILTAVTIPMHHSHTTDLVLVSVLPVIIKPTLLKAFIGSRKILGLTLSHHREISPTDKLGSRITIKPAFARMKYIKKNIMDADNAMKKEFVFLKKFIDT